MGNPYRIEGPALISFSGGRTSGYMLWHILDAYDGKLPDDVFVTFANTGEEAHQTLRFVHDCETHWGVRMRWLEWLDRRKRTPVEERFEEVGFNSASRNGEPFDRLIASKGAVPNQAHRWCTEHLKVQVMFDFMLAQGHANGTYKEAIGLRDDERWRYWKMLDRNERDQRQCVAPLVQAGVTKAVILDWWAQQPFDLDLDPRLPDGNCTYCFLKGKRNLKFLIRGERPGLDRWKAREALYGDYSSRYSLADLEREVVASPTIPLLIADEDVEEWDAECGLVCSSE